MTKINLLPWREDLRKQQTQDFIRHASLVSILAFCIIFVGYTQVDNLLDTQKSRLKFIQDETSHLQKELAEIDKLEKTKTELLSRLRIVQDLQGDRPKVVHLFHEISHTIPSGVFLKAITQVKDDIEIVGEAESNSLVSLYMKNLGESSWLTKARLSSITTDPISRNSLFKLNIQFKKADKKE